MSLEIDWNYRDITIIHDCLINDLIREDIYNLHTLLVCDYSTLAQSNVASTKFHIFLFMSHAMNGILQHF